MFTSHLLRDGHKTISLDSVPHCKPIKARFRCNSSLFQTSHKYICSAVANFFKGLQVYEIYWLTFFGDKYILTLKFIFLKIHIFVVMFTKNTLYLLMGFKKFERILVLVAPLSTPRLVALPTPRMTSFEGIQKSPLRIFW